jgi:hypothetical protein
LFNSARHHRSSPIDRLQFHSSSLASNRRRTDRMCRLLLNLERWRQRSPPTSARSSAAASRGASAEQAICATNGATASGACSARAAR